MLPRFLFADNSQELPETVFVVHTQAPRFIIECDIEDFTKAQLIHWIDDKPETDAVIAELVELAEEFFEAELDNQLDLFDEEEEEE